MQMLIPIDFVKKVERNFYFINIEINTIKNSSIK
jgi:hypothetical protein